MKQKKTPMKHWSFESVLMFFISVLLHRMLQRQLP